MPLTRKAPFDDLDRFFEKFVAVGIDFGTTYTGVSWARSTDPKDINSITGWPSSDHRSKNEIQVPTLYDLTSHKWGYEITPDMKPMKWFKLLLLKKEDLTREAGGDSQQLKQTLEILDTIGRDITPVQLVGLYLKKVWDHTYTSLRSMIDIDNLPLRVAITVPAIWPDYAKSSMREAARLAGITDHRAIGETTLITVEEPEAAALASVFQRNSFFEIKRNDSFVVCDAGGGTIDVISYKVVCEQPFKLEECIPGRGKLDGAFLIDQAFFAYLQGKAKLKIKSLTASDYNGFILKEWELGAKRSFSSADEPEFYNLHPPSDAYGTIARIRKKETLVISKLDMVGFFNRSLTGIRHLVGDQYKQVRSVTGEDPKRILLVGGLGSSEYIYNALNETFFQLLTSMRWSAVARGAALRLLQENIASQRVRSPLRTKLLGVLPDVVSRRSRYHYGILAKTPIANLDRDPHDVVLTDPDGIKVTLRMNWYLHKGDKVDKETRIPISYYQHSRESQPLPPKCTFQILYCGDSIAPKRKTGTVLPLCRIECEWDKPITEWKRIGPPSSGWRKHDDLEVTMGLQGEPKWMVRVGSKKQEHRFNIEYIS
ncbi:heat shock 70 kda protein 12b [Fusarium flagelliforme]|uniref:Heat shock 70 kDa protein 12b n=1 Tax=Fusarium flagelliforme TaxID=2675880 RepID=A0A395MN72_9HYPO|nr:heat shock 70 kda protein 12b [Fusarium flagelliforme]